MKSVYIILGIVVLILIIGFIVVFGLSSMNNNVNNSNNNPIKTNTSIKIKLSDTSYADKVYLISGDTLDSNAQKATSGFQIVNNKLPDGSMSITLKALSGEYKDQGYVLKPGEQLYFIEKTMGDDTPNGDLSLGDDSAVIVDSDGYIVNK